MRFTLGLILLLALAPLANAQLKEAERRYGVLLNLELYPQDTAKNTLASLIRAMDKDRYDYLAAHLIDRAYIEDQLKISYPLFEKRASEQVQSEGLEKKGVDKEFIRKRIVELAVQANFEYLVGRLKTKLSTDPESLKELKRLNREGDIQEGGEAATAKLKDIKDRALYFRRIEARWFVENKMAEDQ